MLLAAPQSDVFQCSIKNFPTTSTRMTFRTPWRCTSGIFVPQVYLRGQVELQEYLRFRPGCSLE